MERLRGQFTWDIIYRLRAGQSQRAIVRDLGYAPDTVRRYAKWAERMGYLDPSSALAKLEDLQVGLLAPYSKSNISSVEPYRDVVKAFLDQGVEMAAIHNRLRRNHGYNGSYMSIRHFVANLLPKESFALMRVETAPGAGALLSTRRARYGT